MSTSTSVEETKKIGFDAFGLSKEMLETLEILGYHTPKPIQQEAIPAILHGQDFVGKSQTGSGKTAAFAIPICEKVIWEENAPQALVLEPTRELAVQVQEEIFQIGRKRRIKVPVIFGGMPIDKQTLSLKQKAHIVVGTPGRVLDHLRRENLNLHKVSYLVIDEADLMLDMGFLEDVETVITSLKKKPILLLFSATLGSHLERLIQTYMNHPKQITIASKAETADGLEQVAYEVENEQKFQALLELLAVENPETAMIFCDTREMVNTLYEKLKRKKIRCGMLHGGMEQRDRLYSISDFRKGKFRYLITTDVAARGIDFENITHVFNYDFPTKRENYVHRIGRSGRNGKKGKAISFFSSAERTYKRAVEAYIKLTIEEKELPDRQEIESGRKNFEKRQKEKIVLKEGKGAAFKDTIMKLVIGGGKKSKMRPADVVGAICAIDGLTQEDIGVIDVRESLTYVEILNGKGKTVLQALQKKSVKGKLRTVKKAK